MDGFRFYADYGTPKLKRAAYDCDWRERPKPAPVCLALFTGSEHVNADGTREAIVAVYDMPNSGVASSSVSLDYLRKCCRRIAENGARKIHPALFERLDKGELSC